MSATSARAQIVAALSRVDGVSAHPTMPRTLAAGQAWPEWAGLTRISFGALEDTWNVIYLLPQGFQAGSAHIEAVVEPIWEALEAMTVNTTGGQVVTADHITLPTGDGGATVLGEQHGLRYTVTTSREHCQ